MEFQQDGEMILIALQIKNIRGFLHPKTSSVSPAELHARYLIVYMLTSSIAQSLLSLLDITEEYWIYTTLCRMSLIVRKEHLSVIDYLLERASDTLKILSPDLYFELNTENFSMNDFTSKSFFEKFKKCHQSNESKVKQRVAFTESDFSSEKVSRFLREIAEQSYNLVEFNQCEYVPFFSSKNEGANKDSLPRAISFNKNCKHPKPFELIGRCKNNLPWDLLEESFDGLASKANNFAIMRMDVKGFNADLLANSPGCFISIKTISKECKTYFTRTIPDLCDNFNALQTVENRIFILHSVADDVVLFGKQNSLELIRDIIQTDIKSRLNITMVAGISLIEKGKSSSQTSREALADMMNTPISA